MNTLIPRRILIVEDDRNIALSLEQALKDEGFETCLARDGASGRSFAHNYRPDLVILDRILPDCDGLEVLISIRSREKVPVLFLTARDEIQDKVVGLEAGADDYLTKPFDIRELVARVRTLLRRTSTAAPPSNTLSYGPIMILVEDRKATREGTVLQLTRIEFDLLSYFVRNPCIVLTRESLLEAVWGYSFEGYQRTVDTHIRRLRIKLEPDPDRPEFIHTVRGAGYRFDHIPRGK